MWKSDVYVVLKEDYVDTPPYIVRGMGLVCRSLRNVGQELCKFWEDGVWQAMFSHTLYHQQLSC